MNKNPDIYRNNLTHGLYARVARRLGLSESGRAHVLRVAKGERRSPRVERALTAELQRINRLVAKYEAKLKSSDTELERAA